MIAWLWLSETFRVFEGVIMAAQVACAFAVMLGAEYGGTSGALTNDTTMTNVIYFLQVFNACTSAAGSIAMRHMKKFHESVITWYSNWSIMLSSLFMIAIQGRGISIFYTFTTESWVLLLLNGITATTF